MKITNLFNSIPSISKSPSFGGVRGGVSLRRGRGGVISLLLFFLPFTLSAQFSGGDGTSDSPYLITTAEELAQLATLVNEDNYYNPVWANKRYKLDNDIDLSEYSENFNNGEGWITIGKDYDYPFKGVFDGNSYKIKNLYINNNSGIIFAGLFGYIYNGSVKNLGVENININININPANNSSYVGGLVGQSNNNSSILNCYTTGKINSSANNLFYTGGIVGYNNNSSISNCYSSCAIKSSTKSNAFVNAGGIAGINEEDGTISYCYSTGSIYASSDSFAFAGGIAGTNESYASISYCAALNPQISCYGQYKYFGRIVGESTWNLSTTNIAFDNMLNPDGNINWNNNNYIDGQSITKSFINTENTLDNRFTSDNGWTVENGKLPGLFGKTVEMPFYLKIDGGTESNPYIIKTAEELALVASYVNSNLEDQFGYNDKYYILDNDIDLSDYGVNFNGEKGWIPIGWYTSDYNKRPFKGFFDGNNKKITGLYINSTDLETTGLFGFIETGTVKNLGVINVDIKSSYNWNFVQTGAIAGRIGFGYNSVRIENCYSSGSVFNSGSDINLGGVVGLNFCGSIENCYSTCSVSSSSNYFSFTGGVVGYVRSICNVSNCYSTGNITSTSSEQSCAGGVAGNTFGLISNCYSTGMIASSGDNLSYIGGIAGSFSEDGKIINCAALNQSLISDGNISVGRIVGRNPSLKELSNNIAFNYMVNPSYNSTWDNIGADKIDGADITIQEINNNGTLGGLFSGNEWTTENGKLPGLFGNTVDMPPHLIFFEFDDGDGSEENPYIITTAQQLEMLAQLVNEGRSDYNNKHYKLGNDLDLSDYNDEEGWIPIGLEYPNSFKGVFDGDGKIISGLYTNNSTLHYVGLFGYIYNAIIKNLGVDADINLSSDYHIYYYTGILAGYSNNSKILNCFSTGAINNSTYNNSSPVTGGIVGENFLESNIFNCYSTASIYVRSDNNTYTGGITGSNYSYISSCYSTSYIESKATNESHTGGIKGYNGGIVSNCAALNPHINSFGDQVFFARIAINLEIHNGLLNNNIAYNNMLNPYSLIEWNNIGADNTDGADISIQSIHEDGTLYGLFTEENGWTTQDGKLPGLFGNTVDMPEHLRIYTFSGGDGTQYDPFIITTPQQLEKLALLVNTNNNDYNNKFYLLGNDIDLSDYGSEFNNGAGWTPIGLLENTLFSGVFDGNNKKVSNLYININDLPFDFAGIGLFGHNNHIIKNLGVKDVQINTTNYATYAGGIAGINHKDILNCWISGEISNSQLTGYARVGGVTGCNSGNISNCYSTATINSSGNDGSYSGGIAGENWSVVLNCYSTGKVNSYGYNSFSGGLAGYNEGSVTNSAALNSGLTCSGYNSNFGRVIGKNENGTLINNIAFDQMEGPNGSTWSNTGATTINGTNFSKQVINADGTLIGQFTSENGWTTQNKKLPGLFGFPVVMPEHLRLTGELYIITDYLPDGEVDNTYSQTLEATSDNQLWSIDFGILPDGLNLSPNGAIWGKPTKAKIYNFTVKVENNSGSDIQQLSITVTTDSVNVTLSVNPPIAGSVEGDGTFKYGDFVSVTAIPNEGWIFENWIKDGEIVSTKETYGFSAIEDVNLIANFVEIKLINIEILSGGLLSPPFSQDCYSYRLLLDCKQNNATAIFEPASYKTEIFADEKPLLRDEQVDLLKVKPGSDIVIVSVVYGAKQNDYDFIIVRPFDDVVIPVWDDVLSVINNPANNGGYNFSEYQWYSDPMMLEEHKLEGEIKGNIQVNDNKNTNFTVWLVANSGESAYGCVKLLSEENLKIKVWPNPATDKITVKVENNPAEFVMELRNMQGILILKKIITQQLFELDINDLPAGIYLLTIEGVTVRLVVND